MDALPVGAENQLTSDGEISLLARSHGLGTFADAVQHVRSLPYGRISDRSDYRLVLGEGRGRAAQSTRCLRPWRRRMGWR